MKYNFYGYRDIQQEEPAAYCSICQGEIYQCDECYLISGEQVCERCVADFEKENRYSIYGYELYDYFNTYGGLDDIE
ncbi:hypothetical protein SDC9_54718 [bioreactor metagenome]|uniref:Uncharacterized protein n=1 Tax=bioreactor metagenome TaxID=1076179 RepID=A0A644WWW6_9ZZZZ